jgi:DNA-binding NtrC family response regulator
MTPHSQVKMIPLLEDKSVRVLAATKKDLDHAAKAGRFNRQLYYRLCVLKIELPPLRERKEDVIPLAEYFAGGRVKKISVRAKRLLRAYGWPGNVRELRNCVDRALVMGDGKTIQPQDLPYNIRRCGKIISAPLRPLHRMEEDYILKVLRYTKWNQQDAARILGIPIQALVDKIKKHRISDQKKDEKTLHLSKN